MPFDDFDHCVSILARLEADKRLRLFEVLAHNLTVAARMIGADGGMTPTEQVQSLNAVNECLHRATARIWVQRLQTHEWSDEDFLSLLRHTDESLHPNVQGAVHRAFHISVATVSA